TSILFFFLSPLVWQTLCLSVSFSDCGTCYQLNMGVIIAIITCDIILTLLITISVYCFASREKKKNSLRPLKAKFRQSSSKPKEVEITESPYQVKCLVLKN
ncbi:TYRO protein tyrosine kinase binding protein precursor, partial [Silurus meridionalis]